MELGRRQHPRLTNSVLNTQMYDSLDDDWVWDGVPVEHLWVFDKLILAKKCCHLAAPVGIDVPHSGWYIIRPCVHVMGFGLGAQRVWIEKKTDEYPLGHFWCEWFTGRHLSVDYSYGKQTLCVEGVKPTDNADLTKWTAWRKTSDEMRLPEILSSFTDYPHVNCEFIGGKLIEVHLRHNPDFRWGQQEYIPVWEGESVNPPDGYTFVDDSEVHGRIGAFIK